METPALGAGHDSRGLPGFRPSCTSGAVAAQTTPRDIPNPGSRPPRRRWAWWKRILVSLSVLAVLAAALYQPILVAVVPLAARKFGAKEHLDVSLKIGGTIFTGLRIENLRVVPTAPGPIEKAEVGLLELHYSLPTLIRHGLNSAFIEDVTLHDADIVYVPGNSPPAAPKKKEPFSLPPLPLPGRLSLRNVSFLMRPAPPETAHAAGQAAAASSSVPAPVAPVVAGATAAAVDQGLLVSDANLELDPERSGELRIAELRIPGGPDLKDVRAGTSYRDRDLQLANLTLSPDIRFRNLTVNGSKLAQQQLGISLDADLFQGSAQATVQLQGIGTPPQANVQVDAHGISLAAIHDFLKLDSPLSGTLDQAAIRFAGNSNEPHSWTGRVDMHVEQPAFGTTALDAVVLAVTLKNGEARVEQADVLAGANKVAARAQIALATKMEDLPQSTGRGTLQIAAPDFTKLPVKLPMEIDGALTSGGDFTLGNGKLTANLKGHIQDLRVPSKEAAVTSVDFGAEVTKALPADATAAPVKPGAPPPPPQPFFAGLRARVAASAEQIQYADYRVDAVKLTLADEQADAKLESVEITRGANRIVAGGTYKLPTDFAAWQQNPLDVQLNIDLPRLSEFAVTPAGGTPLVQGQLAAQGNVSLRRGVYTGGFDLTAANVQAKGARVENADIQIGIADNEATIRSGTIRFDAKNSIDLSGRAGLAAPFAFDAGCTVDLPELSRFEAALRANDVLTPIGGSIHFAARGHGHLATAPGKDDQQITGSLDVQAHDVQAEGAKIESVDTNIVVANNQATIRSGQIKLNAKSAVTFGGDAHLSPPYAYQGNLNVDLPDLGTFAPILSAHGIAGQVGGAIHLAVQGKGHLATNPQANDQALDGTVDLTGAAIAARGLKIDKIDAHIVAADKQATVKTFQIRFNDKNTIDLGGMAAIQAPFAYQANLNVQLLDLGVFQPLLKATQTPTASAKVGAVVAGKKPVIVNPKAGQPAAGDAPLTPQQRAAENALATTKAGQLALAARARQENANSPVPPPQPKIGGMFTLQWQAAGNFAQGGSGPLFSGGAKLKAHQVEVNALGPVEADIEGQYAQEDIEFPTFFVSSNGLELRSTIALKDALARIDNIHLRQGSTDLLAGYLQIPLDLQKLSAPAGPVPDVDKIDINIASKPLALATLFAGIDKSKPAPVQGTVELSVLAHGSLSKILAEVKVTGRDLRSPDKTGLAPANLDVDLALRDSRLTLDTTVRQSQIQPLTIKGNIPLDLAAIVSSKQLDPNSPVALAIELPRSSLGFVAKAVPAVHFIQGDVLTDVKVSGTVAHPIFNGLAEVNVPAVRAEDITVPSVRDFQARLVFGEKQLRFERFGGDVGGGKFSLDGQVDFASLLEPTLKLEAKANNVLAVRDDNATVRVNADIKVTGPIAAATVAGQIGITKSRYLKDIDIVPLNLPGKPAPQPPAPAEGEPSISITAAPISHWKFDLAIKTDDPFSIRGNLATGSATVDLRLRGTGLQPLLDGYVSVNHLVATLPFSRLEIDNGNISFTPDQPLNPVLNLTGTSTVSNYLITLYITGRAKTPSILFTSEPPLAQEQIVSLLATGLTTDQLSSNSEALAGKATLLVLEDLYRRTFGKKKGQPDDEPKTSFADRVNLNLGEVDPETGKQQAGASFKISDTLQFIADFGVEGDLQGRVKYLIRFY
jgi:autotransporter translocation and assembly factor TamB